MKVLSSAATLLICVLTVTLAIPHTSHATNTIKIGLPTINYSNLNSGFLGWWTFDGKTVLSGVAYDQSGQAHDGSLVGTTRTIGKVGEALSFDGGADRVVLSTIPTGSVFTVSMWIKRLTPTTGDGYESLYSADIGFFIHNGALNWWEGSDLINGGTDLGIGLWHMVSITSDGTNLTVYVDGVGDGTVVSGANLPTSAGVGIGGHTYGPEYFHGSIDDVRIYGRALSLTEIKALYNAGMKVGVSQIGPSSSKQALASWWTFDGKSISGTTVLDASGNGYTGTAVGGPVPVIGKVAQGLNFNGTSQYIDTSNFANNLSEFSVSTWFKTTYTGTSRLLVSKLGAGGWGTGVGWGLGIVTGGKISVLAQTDASNYAQVTSSSQSDGKWHHAVMTISGGNTAKLYIDGVENDTTGPNGIGTVSGYSNASNVRIGTDYDSEYFPGSLDNVQIFTRALSAAEAKQLYYAGR